MTDPKTPSDGVPAAADRLSEALANALTGSDSGSDTRAGSLQGGSASGSDDDPDQEIINRTLASEGRASATDDPA